MIQLTHSQTGQKVPLNTPPHGIVKFYSCGPTVYGLLHIGNLRSALVADIVVRTLLAHQYNVKFIRNFTDIDDKIIEQALEKKESIQTLSGRFIAEARHDFQSVSCLTPTHETLATEHIDDMIALIKTLIEKKAAYVTPTQEVLFRVKAFQNYGALSGNIPHHTPSEESHHKENSFDFTLWKPAKPHEPFWESPWGKGRPGWHIECSAMAIKWLGPQMDIHHGGEDLRFPHHENEIAQSECATGIHPFSQVWIHHAFVTIQGQKMSKSIGNIITARECVEKFGPEFTRFFLLRSHYRSIIDFSDTTVQHTIAALRRIYETKRRLEKAFSLLLPEASLEILQKSATFTHEKILSHMADDLNTPEALSFLFLYIRTLNKYLHASATGIKPCTSLLLPFSTLDKVLGFGNQDPQSFLEHMDRIQEKQFGVSLQEVHLLIEKRNQARQQKDFATSDQIRDTLLKMGITLQDNDAYSEWTFK